MGDRLTGGKVPEGQRFSHVYLRRDEQLRDSDRMRRRLGSEIARHLESTKQWSSFTEFFLSETGLKDQPHYPSREVWADYIAQISLRDAIDAVTIFVKFFGNLRREEQRRSSLNAKFRDTSPLFIAEVRRIFAEEQVGYSVDDRGGVHLMVDQQFEVTRAAAIAGMGARPYQQALESLEAGYKALDAIPPDGTQAVRRVFDAAENIFKRITGAPRLAAPIKGKLVRQTAGDLNAQRASGKVELAFAEWVNAAHEYRHVPGHSEPHQPPLDLAVLLVSQGTSFVRWLVSIDSTKDAASGASPTPP